MTHPEATTKRLSHVSLALLSIFLLQTEKDNRPKESVRATPLLLPLSTVTLKNMAEQAPASFISPEHIQEWISFGPKLKGKPTPDQLAAAKVTKEKRKDFTKNMFDSLDAETSKTWTVKTLEKELDRLMEQAAEANAYVRPEYLNAPSGTRDFYPAELAIRNWLFGHMRETALSFGFQEYDCPVLEHVGLYERKAGEEIVDQMYAFTDKEGKRVTLRPEMTPSLARMVLNRTNLQTGEVTSEGGLPLKWFSIPQCWRFETTQRGRKREHYQWNMDVVGVDHVHAEAELLAAASAFFKRLGIGSDIVGIKVNSRAVLESLLAQHGIKKDGEQDIFAQACVIIDKLDKIGGEAVTELLATIGVNAESSAAILKALCAPTIEALSEILGEEGAKSPAIQEVKRLFEIAEEYGYGDYLIFDASVVRGLAYYTGIVWEAFDRRGELRAIMGGGRYDRLLELYGGEKCQIPCVGFGFGDCVIMELLNDLKLVPDFSGGVDYVVCSYSPELYGTSAKISAGLRELGCTVDLMPTPKKKVKNSFAHADRTGARRMVFVAPDEIEKGVVRVKDLRTKDAAGEALQIDCPVDRLDTIDSLLDAAKSS